jgi:putative flippase GtrA
MIEDATSLPVSVGEDPPLTNPLVRASSQAYIRFVIVGAASFAIDAGALFVLHGILHMWLQLATAIAFGIAFFFNFALNHLWSFASGGPATRHFVRYVLLVVANLAVTELLMTGLTELAVPYLWAKTICTGILFVTNYFVSKKWIFT